MRRWIGLAAALGVALVVHASLGGFGESQAKVGAVFAFTVVLWVTETLPLAVASLLSTMLLVVLAGVDEKKAFGAYGNPIIPLFIGSFVLAKAMEVTRLSDRFALGILAKPWAHRSPGALAAALGIVSCLISLLVSNTATTSMMLPIGLAILATLPENSAKTQWATAFLLMLTWGSSVAVGLPIGTPPNLIGMAQIEKATGVGISFGQWATFGMPITVLMTVFAWLILRFRYGKQPLDTASAGHEASAELAQLGPLTPAEKSVLVAFGVALTLWILPDVAEQLLGKKNELAMWLDKRFSEAVAAIIGASFLFILPVKESESGHAIAWREAATIDWGVILLFGGGIALGDAMFESGLAKDLGQAAAAATGVSSIWPITLLCTAAAVALSELASNTAAATTLVPVAIGLAQGAGVSPVAPALGAALGASMGFMLPVSTPPNAIVYSSGKVPMREMVVSGILLDLVSVFVVVGGLWLFLGPLGLR